MSVSQVRNSTPATGDARAASRAASVDYEAFLRLLVAQLKNQDPTNPTDGAQFLSQLASFSSVEQGIQTNTRLDALLTSSLLTQADGIIGRTITSADGATSGRIKSVTISDNALVATLDTGARLPVTNGSVIS